MPPRNRLVVVPDTHYLTLVARAYATRLSSSTSRRGGEPPPPPPPAVRCNFVALYKPRVGVKVCAWFRRNTPTRVPELRVGVAFDLTDAGANDRAGRAFAAGHADALRGLGAERWESETNTDYRLATPLPVPPDGEDLTALAARAAELAVRYVELIREREGGGETRGQGDTGAGSRGSVESADVAPRDAF